MTRTLIECDQGSDAWFRYRMGIPTASEFHTVMLELKRGGESKTRRTYMLKLAGERVTGEPTSFSYTNQTMVRGKLIEDEARAYYLLMTNAEIRRVGFILNTELQCGCSPDALVGKDGMLEIKSKFPHLICDLILADEMPAEHYAQCQGNLWLAEREWIDFLAYWPHMPRFEKRIYRDEPFIKKLAQAVAQFNRELEEIADRVRHYGQPTIAEMAII